MKRIRNSVKAIIISVCVAIVAASAIVGVVLFNRNKGDKNPPVQPQGSYQLTPAQKELVESINAEQKLQAETSSKVLKEVDESMFVTETGASVDVETISAVYDDCFVVNDGDNINIYFYSEDEHGNKTSINLFSYMREENLIEQNYTSIKANQIHEDYVAYTYTYSDGTKAYQVLEVAYVPNLEEIAVVNRVVFENLSGTFYFDEKEVVEIDIIFKKSYYLIYHQYYEENSLCLNYSLYYLNLCLKF